MAQSIGQKLAAARKRRDFTIEDVAHETRIQPDTLRHLEADDYSNFPTLTYAKSFLSIYSKHLGLDVSDYLKQFGPANGSDSGIDNSSNGHREADPLVPVREPQKRRPILTLLAILIFISAIPGMYIIGRLHGFQSAKRFTVDTSAQTVMAPAVKPASPDPKDEPVTRQERIAEQKSPTDSTTLASRQAKIINDAANSPAETGPVRSANPIELPPPPADGEEVEVRRPAILIEDDAPSLPPSNASTGTDDLPAPKAVPFEATSN